eukprot:6446832-Amphidinium_carterae.1
MESAWRWHVGQKVDADFALPFVGVIDFSDAFYTLPLQEADRGSSGGSPLGWQVLLCFGLGWPGPGG